MTGVRSAGPAKKPVRWHYPSGKYPIPRSVYDAESALGHVLENVFIFNLSKKSPASNVIKMKAVDGGLICVRWSWSSI